MFRPFSGGGFRLRPVALVLTQIITLGLGAAGAVAWQNSTAPVPQVQDTVIQRQADPECLPAAAGTMSVADIAEMANPAVVTITNRAIVEGEQMPQAAPDPSGEETLPVGTGSGFIIDASGIVVTNSHVVFGADELEVRFFDGTRVPGTVVGLDDPNLLDVAVVQLDLSDGTQVPGVLTMGDSDAIRPGDRVVAIGSALGEFTNTVTEGMVNAVGRSLGGYGLNTLIQHDANIWRGNSGGPLLNMQGEVIGVNSAGMSGNQMSVAAPAEMAFAISSNAVRTIVDEVLETGTVARPYLGIIGGPVEAGHEVASVEPGTPAADAGLLEGDIITEVNGEAIDAETTLLDLLFGYRPGDTITLTVLRDGETISLDLVLGTRPLLTQ